MTRDDLRAAAEAPHRKPPDIFENPSLYARLAAKLAAAEKRIAELESAPSDAEIEKQIRHIMRDASPPFGETIQRLVGFVHRARHDCRLTRLREWLRRGGVTLSASPKEVQCVLDDRQSTIAKIDELLAEGKEGGDE